MEEWIDFTEVKEVNLYLHNLGRSDPGWISTSKETFRKNTWKDLFLLNWLVRLWLKMYWRPAQALWGGVPGNGLCMPSDVPAQALVMGRPGHGDVPIIWLLSDLMLWKSALLRFLDSLNVRGGMVDIIPLTTTSIRLLLYRINYSKWKISKNSQRSKISGNKFITFRR